MKRLRAWAQQLKTELVALWLCSRHPRTPLAARLVALAVIAYAASPIDLIPDFIPVLGYLDDLILLPAGIYLAVRLVPGDVLAECREQAARTPDTGQPRRKSYAIAAVIVVLWVLCAWVLWLWLRRWL
ncbi:MAG: DUF1232 domain-containing protein [Betaproteobacteria bacterium]|nr:DUF1232 domain-containing protein [Betaproteobacteria bacterium]